MSTKWKMVRNYTIWAVIFGPTAAAPFFVGNHATHVQWMISAFVVLLALATSHAPYGEATYVQTNEEYSGGGGGGCGFFW
jgi:hypothetical protein